MRSRHVVVFLLGLLVACGDDSQHSHGDPDAGVDATGDAGLGETLCATLAPVASGTCEVTPGGDAKLIKGDILTPETVFVGGQVAVDSTGQITCVGCDCAQGGETTISCPGAAVSPGLINTHDHITFTQNNPYTQNPAVRYEHRHQWRKGAGADHPKIPAAGGASGVRISWGELRFVMGGATSIVGSGGQPGLLRNLDDTTKEEGLNHKAVKFDTFPLGDSSGTMLESGCNYGTVITTAAIAPYKSYEPHTSEGINLAASNEFRCESDMNYDTVAPGLSADLLQPQTAMIHAIGLTAANLGAMATADTALIWSPRSNITLYGDTARVTVAAALGVEIALGTDWMPTGSMNLLRELRCADEFNQTYLNKYFSDKQLWEMVTLNAAAVTATDDAIGLLAPNHVADISIFKSNGKPGYRAVIDAEPKDVALVMRAGVALYGDDAIVGGLTSSCDTVDVCGVSKRVCTKREIGKTYDELVAAVGTIYPAFACGTPMNEPSCVPRRPQSVSGSSVYTAGPGGSDADGDGVDDAADNCPLVFNPVRPMDALKQPDADGDGVGDPCDVCPLDAGVTNCPSNNVDDRDHDGIVNVDDNCPEDVNPAQTDADSDKKGDVCDACPSDANPGTAGCPSSIYRVKLGMDPEGSTVRIDNALVTGKGTNGFFIQTKAGDAGYMGSDNSGLFVFTGANMAQLGSAVVGMRVAVDGTVLNYNGQQLEISPVTAVLPMTMVVESAPTPVGVTYTDVKTGGTKATALESVLVSLGAASITGLNATYGEYTLTSGADTLVVDDFLYATPNPAIGQGITTITGVLTHRQSASKLEPRGAADIVSGAPTLASFGPALSYVRNGTSNVNTFPVGSELTVTLSGPAVGDTNVAITAGSNAISVAQNRVTVLSGQTTAKVVLSGLSQNADVTLTAQLGSGTPLTAHVRVLGATEQATVATLSPSTAAVTPNGSVTLNVMLDIPAPPGGTSVALSSTAGATNPAAAVVVAANTMSANVVYTDNVGTGMATVTATLGASTSNSVISVVAGGNNLVINEIDYDQINSDVAEFIEIYNPTGAPVSLANVGVVLINGAGGVVGYKAYPDDTSIIDLGPAGTIPAFGYLVIAGANIAVPNGVLKIDPGWTQDDIQNGLSDGVALVDTASNTLIDSLSYEGAITMAEVPGIANPVSLVEGTVLATSVADSNTAVGSLCRFPNGTDTDNANSDWQFRPTITPGSANQ